MSQSEGKPKSPHLTPTESRARTVSTGTPEIKGAKPKPDLGAFEGSDEDEELDFQLDAEAGEELDFEGSNQRPTYDSSSDEDETEIPDDEVGHIVMIHKVLIKKNFLDSCQNINSQSTN